MLPSHITVIISDFDSGYGGSIPPVAASFTIMNDITTKEPISVYKYADEMTPELREAIENVRGQFQNYLKSTDMRNRLFLGEDWLKRLP